jgi:flagellar P-ring protein precursor FlgI
MIKYLLFILICTTSFNAFAVRVKDISDIQGVRANQLVGYGLVVGLDGSGDTEAFTKQSFKNMLNRLGVTIPATITPGIKNVAAVALHASLPAFAKPGQKIDVTVSSIGNAKSIRGGTLLMAPLKGADGQIYALAQGSLIVGGLSAEGLDGSKIAVNIPVVGRIPNGGIVERGVPNPFALTKTLIFNLHQPDFTTAKRLSDAINKHIGEGAAIALDSASVRVNTPKDVSSKVTFVSAIENIVLRPAEVSARVIVNSRTGTIVIGKNVSVGPAAISHGNLTVTITENKAVSQPNPLSAGATTTVENSEVVVTQDNSRMFLLQPDVSLDSIVSAVNKVGAAPSDLMAILEALKQAGALSAELEII